MTSPHIRAAALSVALLTVTALASCGGDAATGPSAAAGAYRLRTVNGQQVPYTSVTLGAYIVITSGDLVLRPDGTLRLGLADGGGWAASGTYSVSGSALTLQLSSDAPGQARMFSGFVAGDSAVIDVPSSTSGGPSFRYVYDRYTPSPGPITSGRYALVQVTGVAQSSGPGFVTYDSTVDGIHMVERVLFDTLSFSDGVFFRRHRADSLTSNDSPAYSSESDEWGTYTGSAGMVELHRYATPGSPPDTLQATSAALTKLYSRTGLELRYAAVP